MSHDKENGVAVNERNLLVQLFRIKLWKINMSNKKKKFWQFIAQTVVQL